ncbi:unnamed protein product [Tuwongella immobilis]|uniref:Uncharacterized protein n=2 Tax=Tuwongella immobilis TaxID=692036 RepID=A0A6C2YUR5_9BACT|nr:unnamed protein product [Tuwongella immobilis]VTS07550.1 unnamed protein product [Tuwongella immobilis]
MSQNGIGRILWQRGGLGRYAWIELTWLPNVQTEIDIPEDVLAIDREWGGAAEVGIRLALEIAGQTGHVMVTHLRGMVVDTTAMVVCLAAMTATWDALRWPVPPALGDTIQSWIAMRSPDWNAMVQQFRNWVNWMNPG